MEKKRRHDVGKEMEKAKVSIKRLLASQIVSAYYYQEGAVRNSLRTDKITGEALKLLADIARYSELLMPKAE